MRFHRSSWALLPASLLLLTACGEAEALNQPDAGPADATPSDAAVDADAGPSGVIRIRGTLETTTEQGVTTSPLPGATFCQTRPTDGPCTTTDATGAYNLEGVTAEAEVLLEASGPDVPSYLLPLRTGTANGNLSLPLLPSAVVSGWGALTGGTLDPSRGILIVQVAAPDATVTLSPDDARVHAYTDLAGGAPNPALSKSSPHGFAVFLDVPPGEHTVQVEHATRLCRRGLGWAGASDQIARGPIEAGKVTRITVACRVQ